MIRIVSSLIVVTASTVAVFATQQGPVFRGGGEAVPVFVTVTGDDDRLVTNLTRDDFEVRDNGRPQPITVFDNSPQPIRLIVMLDVSGSMVGNLNLIRAASDQLFAHLGPDDLARVGTFGEQIVISPEFTKDRMALRAALPTEIDPGAPTPLWRSVDQSMGTFEGAEGRRVVLVLSDGKDSGVTRFGQKFISQLEIVDRAQKENVMIYGVGLVSRSGRAPMPGENLMTFMSDDLPDPGLGRTATETGGGYVELRARDNLGAEFARILDELHSQYLIGFAPPARDGKSHKIEVRVKTRGLEPRARRAYVAPAASAQ